MSARRGRGRPQTFTEDVRDRFLEAVADGMYLGDAARHVGLHANIPSRYARTDPAFAAALAHAKTLGKKRRAESFTHGESGYTNHACRCDICRPAATAARAGRRAATSEDPEPEAEVIGLDRQSPTSFSLPCPSVHQAPRAA
ncbi:hypothetical protein [Streptomyces sp. NPDC006551]|uniref:hypothetical protein n=1 Tax=Streptomyces sp. NPDC006551 TaxID=3157178 RepID=UPI0033AAC474